LSSIDDRAAGLVYIAALAPDEEETSQSQQDQFPRTDIFSHIEIADGRVWTLPEGIRYFAGDLSVEEQKVVWATQGVPAADLFDQKMKTSPADRSRGGTDRRVAGPSAEQVSSSYRRICADDQIGEFQKYRERYREFATRSQRTLAAH
jgi:hypothetical protein